MHSHFYSLQQLLSGHLHSIVQAAKPDMNRTLLYHSHISKYIQIRNIGNYLEPRYILGAESLDQ